ncbi:hypothetical protein SRHO_G00123660 [Serrasalmus rhombeus]
MVDTVICHPMDMEVMLVCSRKASLGQTCYREQIWLLTFTCQNTWHKHHCATCDGDEAFPLHSNLMRPCPALVLRARIHRSLAICLICHLPGQCNQERSHKLKELQPLRGMGLKRNSSELVQRCRIEMTEWVYAMETNSKTVQRKWGLLLEGDLMRRMQMRMHWLWLVVQE